MARSIQFNEDVQRLVAAYREDGKGYMLCKLREIDTAKNLKWFEASALLEAVYAELIPGNDKDARLARIALSKA